jgi:hypothetical protein
MDICKCMSARKSITSDTELDRAAWLLARSALGWLDARTHPVGQ